MKLFKYLLVLSIFFVACSNDVHNLSKDGNLKTNEFIAAFKPIENIVVINDTSILSLSDTAKINHQLLSKFVSDSSFRSIVNNDKKTNIYALGKIVKTYTNYVLLNVVHNKVPSLFVLVYDHENKFLVSHHISTFNKNADGYVYSVTINREPTFFVKRQKFFADKETQFTKSALAFNGKSFVIASTESNENDAKFVPIVNPISSMLSLNTFSGDYEIDERNFLSVRDGKSKTGYVFFMHIEKNEGNCIGELKGDIQIADSGKAKYVASGEPCAVEFSFNKNIVVVKENGSCGNRRGLDCKFDDAFTKKKNTTAKLPTTPLINTPKSLQKPATPTNNDLKLSSKKSIIKQVLPATNTPSKPVQKANNSKPKQKPKEDENPYGN